MPVSVRGVFALREMEKKKKKNKKKKKETNNNKKKQITRRNIRRNYLQLAVPPRILRQCLRIRTQKQ